MAPPRRRAAFVFPGQGRDGFPPAYIDQGYRRVRSGNGEGVTGRILTISCNVTTCPLCGSPFIDNYMRLTPSPIVGYWSEALNGQRLIDDEAERGVRAWASPTELARLLLMRRDPKTTHLKCSGSFRLLGVVVPETDAVVVDSQVSLPSPASPILPLWLRPALLAGVSIVERQGPAILAWLQSKALGQNRTRFSELASTMLSVPPEPTTLSILQHN
jgi:hypothetical protein